MTALPFDVTQLSLAVPMASGMAHTIEARTAAATEASEKALTHRLVNIRAAAVRALSRAGNVDLLDVAAADDSWMVRKEVAHSLAAL